MQCRELGRTHLSTKRGLRVLPSLTCQGAEFSTRWGDGKQATAGVCALTHYQPTLRNQRLHAAQQGGCTQPQYLRQRARLHRPVALHQAQLRKLSPLDAQARYAGLKMRHQPACKLARLTRRAIRNDHTSYFNPLRHLVQIGTTTSWVGSGT